MIAGVIGAVAVGGYFYGKKQTNIIPSPTPTGIVSVAPTQQLIGNDKDEHGCIGSAGYTWCAVKNKCLRIWEEPCPASTTSDADAIKNALFQKNKWKETDGITVTVSTNDGQYASGTVTAQGGGGYFYAIKVNGEWKIVADGNGTISCASLIPYPDYPSSLIPECYDEKTGTTIKR